jgi:hypothetical protein
MQLYADTQSPAGYLQMTTDTESVKACSFPWKSVCNTLCYLLAEMLYLVINIESVFLAVAVFTQVCQDDLIGLLYAKG